MTPSFGERPAHATERLTQGGDGLDLACLRRRLVGYAIKLVWNRDDAEELVQEAFRIAVRRAIQWGDAGAIPWMFRTVSHLAVNLRRRRRPEPLVEHLPAEAGVDLPERAEELDRLRQAIAELPDQQRLAIVLRTQEQMDYDQVAAVMRLSVAAVRTHVHLARRKLIERLEGQP